MRRRTFMSLAEMLRSKPLAVNAAGAFCMTCLRPVDVEEIVEEGRGWTKVRVQCHGQEEVGVFELGELGTGGVERGMARRQWFNPASDLEKGNVLNGGRA